MLQRHIGVLLVAALLVLVPAAYADPPDPTWIGGYWDDNDFDNVVIFIVSVCAVEVPSIADVGPLWTPLIGSKPLPPTFVQGTPSKRARLRSLAPYSRDA